MLANLLAIKRNLKKKDQHPHQTAFCDAPICSLLLAISVLDLKYTQQSSGIERNLFDLDSSQVVLTYPECLLPSLERVSRAGKHLRCGEVSENRTRRQKPDRTASLMAFWFFKHKSEGLEYLLYRQHHGTTPMCSQNDSHFVGVVSFLTSMTSPDTHNVNSNTNKFQFSCLHRSTTSMSNINFAQAHFDRARVKSRNHSTVAETREIVWCNAEQSRALRPSSLA